MTSMHQVRVGLLLLAVTGLSAQDAPAPGGTAAEQERAAMAAAQELRVSGGDLLEITVYGVPELSREVRVSDEGEVMLPLLGTMKLAGMNAAEAESLLRERLVAKGMLNDPQVLVLIKEFSTQGITVLGEVAQPGVYALAGEQRLLNALSAAGGLTQKAGRTATVVRRHGTGERITVSLGTDPATSAEANLMLMPGDTVMVAKAGLVYVVGDVNRPGGFIMENNTTMTVLQALALAHGAKPSAGLKNAKLIRRTEAGAQEIPIPLQEILSAKHSDQPLQADDVLFVPESKGKAAAQKSLETLLRIATGLAVYGPL